MGKEETVESIGSEVAKEFGEERIKNIEYFGHYECGDLNVRVRVEGLTDRDEGYKVHSVDCLISYSNLESMCRSR